MSLFSSPVFFGASGTTPAVIQNALRFREANSARMTRTFTSVGNRKTWTYSIWVKRGSLGSVERALFNTNSGNDQLEFSSSDTLTVQFGGATALNTSAVYRDVSAWYHVVLAVDTTQATAANRVRLYVNGSEVTAFATASYPSLNADLAFNNNTQHEIGWNTGSSYYDGLIARPEFVGDLQLTPSSFGQTDAATNMWVPKVYAGSYGTNGFRLTFADTTSTTTLGNDTSGNGNNWTLTNFSVTAGVTYDPSTDVPTNTCCSWSPLTNQDGAVLSWANMRATGSGAAARAVLGSAALDATTKIYVEFTVTTTFNVNYPALGLVSVDNRQPTGFIGSAGTGVRSFAAIPSGYVYKNYDGAQTSVGPITTYTTGSVVMMAFDPNTGKFWYGVNGTWYNSGDPAAGTNATFTDTNFIGLRLTPVVSTYDSSVVDLNCEQRPFAYTAPTGFKALCTANLPTPAIRKSSDGFALVTDTEANIEATLATAQSGWTDYVDILKNRAVAETWAWRFSYDSGNEYAISTTATYQAARALSGSNAWIGHSIRIGSTYGTAAGSVSHTNGVASTITHNLNRARTSIFLFPRAGGDIYVYHPDVTAGSLLILNSTAAAAASTRITSVGVNSFQIGSTAATGTYDYLVVSEIEGFMDLGTYVGNSSSDGTFSFNAVRPRWYFTRATASGVQWMAWNDLSDGYNVANDQMRLDDSAAESVSADVDLLSNGVKFRRSSTNFNNTGSTYVTWAWGNPLKTANAR